VCLIAEPGDAIKALRGLLKVVLRRFRQRAAEAREINESR
jgi:hypothetical protein